MSHITYHYLLNGFTIKGAYLYDVNHLPDKTLRNKIYRGYVEAKIKGLTQIIKDNNSPKDVEFSRYVLDRLSQYSTLKDKANEWFRICYERRGYEQLLGKPYFGIWGIHTTPADLFGIMPRYKYRIAIDLDTIDPDVIIIRKGISRSVKDKNANRYFKYNESNWNKLCGWFSDGDKWIKKAYPGDFVPRTVSGGVPDVMIFLPRLKFDKSDIEVYKG